MPISAPLTATGSGTTTANVVIPAGASAGQGAILVIATQPDGTISTPTGWTAVHSSAQAPPSGVIAAVYKCIIQATGTNSPGSTVTINVGGTVPPKTVSVVAVYGGTDQVDAVHATGTPIVYTSSATGRATPAVTTTMADTWIVEIVTSKGTSQTNYTEPAGYTKRAQVFGSGSAPAIVLGDKNAAVAAGTHGGETWTCDVSSGSAISYTIALAPRLTTQTARPATDVTDWPTGVPAIPVGQDQAPRVGESVRDDSTYLESSANPTSEVGEWRLAAMSDPASSTGHDVKYVLGSAGTATSSSVAVSLMQGTTVIASWTETSVPDTPTLYTHTLTGTQADSITDYANLRLRVSATAS